MVLAVLELLNMPEDKLARKYYCKKKKCEVCYGSEAVFSSEKLMAFIFGMHIDIFQLSSTRFQVFQILGKLKAMTKDRV